MRRNDLTSQAFPSAPWPARLFAAAVAVAACAGGCKREANAFAPPPVPPVTVAHPVQRTVTRYIESTGTTEAFETVELRARVPGFLDKILVAPGASVKKGDLLYVIDKRTYQAAADRAEARVLADDAAYRADASDAKIAEDLFAQRAGSEIDKIVKVGRRDSAKAEVEASKAAWQTAKLDLEFCDVRAPADGRVTRNAVDAGNLVGAAGQPTVLATLVRSKPVYVTLDASERDMTTVRRQRLDSGGADAKPGEMSPGVWRPVELATTGQEEFTFRGHIDYVEPQINPTTGTARVRCVFANDDEGLFPGSFVRARVLLDTAAALLVPDIALLSNQAGRFALVVNDKNVVETRKVKIGAADGELRVVTEGLTVADRVVVNGLYRARPGVTVAPTLADLKPAPAATSPSTAMATTTAAATRSTGDATATRSR